MYPILLTSMFRITIPLLTSFTPKQVDEWWSLLALCITVNTNWRVKARRLHHPSNSPCYCKCKRVKAWEWGFLLTWEWGCLLTWEWGCLLTWEWGYLLTAFPVCFQVKVVLESGHILTREERAPPEKCGGVSDSTLWSMCGGLTSFFQTHSSRVCRFCILSWQHRLLGSSTSALSVCVCVWVCEGGRGGGKGEGGRCRGKGHRGRGKREGKGGEKKGQGEGWKMREKVNKLCKASTLHITSGDSCTWIYQSLNSLNYCLHSRRVHVAVNHVRQTLQM